MKREYDYFSSWGQYAEEEEENRFLSCEEEDLLKICECIHLDSCEKQKITGSIPIHYDKENKKLYVLCGDGHCEILAETGSKKSRAVALGSLICSVKSENSFCCIDPKGELHSNNKIQQLMKDHGYQAYVLDFRTFDKDRFNIFGQILRNMKKGKKEKAMDGCIRFGGIISEHKKSRDDFWNDCAVMLITMAMQILLIALSQKEEGLEKYFHLASLRSFITKNSEDLIEICDCILDDALEEPLHNPLRCFKDILLNPDRTYACIVSSADALLRSFGVSESTLRMLSEDTFDVETFYEMPSGLFVVVPDEVSAYDEVTGYIFDIIYQILVEVYSEKYQNNAPAPCNIHFICDELASVRINGMANKISASRSRQIYWNLIYQSEKQMEKAYENDFGTIQGNCKHHIFLGSSDYEILKRISEKTGNKVSVDSLRAMKKEKDYKEALVMSGNYLVCARLPDYDSYDFLRTGEALEWKSPEERMDIEVYTPMHLHSDYLEDKISFFSKKEKMEEDFHNVDEQRKYIQEELYKAFDELFGLTEETTEEEDDD